MIQSINNFTSIMNTFLQKRVETTFNSSDNDGDGKLNESEFNTFLNSLAEQSEATDVDTLYANADTDGDGLLSFEEAQAARSEQPAEAQVMMDVAQHRLRLAFAAADEDGDGKLSKAEYEVFIANMPAPPEGAENTAKDTAARFTETDTDGDGLLSLEEVMDVAPQGPPPLSMTDAGGDTDSPIQVTLADLIVSTGLGVQPRGSTLFNYLDVNQDGLIDKEEMLNTFSRDVTEMYLVIQQSDVGNGADLDVNA